MAGHNNDMIFKHVCRMEIIANCLVLKQQELDLGENFLAC